MAKHTLSIYNLIDDKCDNLALFEEKITDHINYLLLLKCLLKDEYEANKEPITENDLTAEQLANKLLSAMDFAIKATDSNDDYGVGMQNGIRYCKSLITNEDPEYKQTPIPQPCRETNASMTIKANKEEIKYDTL